LAWKIEFDRDAVKDLKKISKPDQKRIIEYLKKRISPLKSPKILGKPLKGEFMGLWRYRVGDYRIICKIEDHDLIILVVIIGHRKNVYH
jgi:mRNA interferase RelE/StbE